MDNQSSLVKKTYNSLAEKYDIWASTKRSDERNEYLKKIQDYIPINAKILDIGCGNGLLDAKVLSYNYKLVGIDISERQIEEARNNNIKGVFICSDIRDCKFKRQSFSGIVSFYCFNHIPRNTYRRLLKKLFSWLKPNGYLIGSFGVGDNEGWIGKWLGETTNFSSDTFENTLAVITNSGFKIEEAKIYIENEDGNEVPFLWVIAKK